MTSRTQRKLFIAFVLVGITLAGVFADPAFQENLLYFFSPTQVAAGEAPERTFRRIERLHWVLLTVSLLTVLGAVAGSHGFVS